MARPSPPAPAAHAEHTGEWPGSPSGLCSKPFDRPTDRQTDRCPSAAGSHCQCPRSPVPGSSLLAVGARPGGAVPFLPGPGSVSCGGSAGIGLAPAAAPRAPRAPAGSAEPRTHPAGGQAGPAAPSRQLVGPQGSSPSCPPLLVAAAEKKHLFRHTRGCQVVSGALMAGAVTSTASSASGRAESKSAERGISQGLQVILIHAKKSQSGIPERQKPEELSRLLGRLVIYTSVAQAKPFTQHLLRVRIRISAGLPESWSAAWGFSSKIEFIAKNV
ncbi:uncharacterized protein LOC120513257 [Passer montanus]|uniref:uncharacterized protein LOC120513257 n=1 Tax=Passer montanus TaxID=9160 RepID=UPI001960AFD1|nr:uncharacterized protein LOC120513257 [Passer montanus]